MRVALLITFVLALLPATASAAPDSLTRVTFGHGTVTASSEPGQPVAPVCLAPASIPQEQVFDCGTMSAAPFGTCTTRNPTVPATCEILLTAEPPPGWAFDHWSGDTCGGTVSTCRFSTLRRTCTPTCDTIALGPWVVEAHFVDTRRPTIDTFTGPTGVVASETRQQTFAFDTNEDDELPTFECRLDGGDFAACRSPRALVGLADGKHEFCVRAFDASALPSTNVPCRIWEQEVTPTAAVVSGPAAVTGSTEAAFTYTSNKSTHAADGSVLVFECRIDAEPFAACPAAGRTFTGLGAGEHSFAARAVFHGALDAAGVRRVSGEATHAWTVDLTPPSTAIISGPAEGATIVDVAPTFEFAGSEPGSSFTCRVDAGAAVPCTSPFTTAQLASGPHAFSVTATDAVGNADPAPATRTFTLATLLPAPTDRDGDRFSAALDCDDDDAAIHPGARELPGNRVDENCDGVIAPFSRVDASISVAGTAFATKTKFNRLNATEVPAGARVEVRCSATKKRACPFSRVRLTVSRGKADWFRNRRSKTLTIGVGATIEVRITAPELIGKLKRFQITKHTFPRGKTLCLPPGVTRPSSC